MDPLIELSSFLNEHKPYGFFHKIYFKSESESFSNYGGWIYGRFMKVETKFQKKITEKLLLRINAPKINGYNLTMRDGSISELYHKGILFTDIDIAVTYPN